MSHFSRVQLERVEQQLRALAGEFTHVQVVRFSAAHCWTPAVNVYRCIDRFVVCADLAGVHEQELTIKAEPRRVCISGHRSPPNPHTGLPKPLQVLAMEIDYGRFERELRLPDEIDADNAAAEQRDGWLWIELPLKSQP